MSNSVRILKKAIDLYQASEFQDLAQLHHASRLQPDNPVCFNLLGAVQYKLGDLKDSLHSFERAIELKPDNDEAYSNCGVVLLDLGQFDDALASCSRAIAIKPNLPEHHHNRGLVLERLKSLDEALASHERALELDPGHAEARHHQGILLDRLGRFGEAIASLQQAVQLRPDSPHAHFELGLVFYHSKQPDNALASFNRAIELRPDFAEAYSNKGIVLKDLGRLEEALATYNRAVELKPLYAEAYSNRGIILKQLKAYEEALFDYRRAIELRPDYVEAWYNQGVVLHALKRPAAALHCYDRAIEIDPEYIDANWNRSLLQLLVGNFAEGWRGYGWRRRKNPPPNRSFAKPNPINVAELAGKTLLLYWEQGLGDTIQFSRYIPLLEAAGVTVLFAPQPGLKRLLCSMRSSMRIVDLDDSGVEYDFHSSLMDLPRLFETSLATISCDTPYLFAEPDGCKKWKAILGDHGFKIGICWKGNSAHKDDSARSFHPRYFDNISTIKGVKLISLHKGDGESQLRELPPEISLTYLGDQFDAGADAFVDTAAVMMNLDLVVTADTAIAHLAGALGVPVWLALKYVADWRWLLDRSDSPWYPSMRLFRQRSDGDWRGVFDEIEKELRSIIEPIPRKTSLDMAQAPISWGELMDKITILEIKQVRLADPAARENVIRELQLLAQAEQSLLKALPELMLLKDSLKATNESLWEVEDRIRAKEQAKQFDDDFIELARLVYQTNDHRAKLKRDINLASGSVLIEEKSYKH